MSTKKSPKWGSLIITTIFVTCVASCSFLVFRFQLADMVCYPQIAKRINVEPNYTAISQYIQEQAIQPGMTLEEALNNTEQVAPVKHHSQSLDNGMKVEYVYINVCPLAFTQVFLLIGYEDQSGKVVSISDLSDNP